MPSERTHYEILGVGPAATSEEIRQRYRFLAKRYHPDVAGASDASAAHHAFGDKAAYVPIDRGARRMIANWRCEPAGTFGKRARLLARATLLRRRRHALARSRRGGATAPRPNPPPDS